MKYNATYVRTRAIVLAKPIHQVKAAFAKVEADLGDGPPGLANKGFAGGYAAALLDVMAVLQGKAPSANLTRHYWETVEEEKTRVHPR